jgi:hypothetical protein
MQLFAIGPDAGPVIIGVAKDAKREASKLEQPLIRSHKLERGWDDLALSIATDGLPLLKRNGAGGAVYRVPATTARTALDKAARATQVGLRPSANFGPAMRRIRNEVFRTTQEVIGAIANVTGSKVSRWESGEIAPDLTEIAKLRAFAVQHQLRWRDEMIFHDYLKRPGG